jgi:hypothetical protein
MKFIIILSALLASAFSFPLFQDILHLRRSPAVAINPEGRFGN